MTTSPMPHPRLYVSAEQLQALDLPAVSRAPGRRPARAAAARPAGRRPDILARAAQRVADDAEIFVRSTEFEYDRDTHNAHLIRARIAQTRVITLLVRFHQTGEDRFRDAAWAHVEAIANWEYWSWITWRQNNADPQAIFDLSYGENSTTLAIAYDWLHTHLDPARRAWMVELAQRRSFASFLKNTDTSDGRKPSWWIGSPHSNWNTVCAGGAGMLALAMLEDAPEAAEVLARAERSMEPYFQSLETSGGAWPEGVGYWNYGMRYGFMYLLSHERAVGREHPALKLAGVVKSLWFPLDFTPNGVPCSFGDVNAWCPMPFHLAIAQRLGQSAVAAELLERLAAEPRAFGNWPDAAETLIFHPRRPGARTKPQRGVVRHYAGQDWTVLADRLPAPRLCMVVRGGTTEVPHGHRDLTSYHCVVEDEAMVPSLGVSEYLDTTFSARRWELFETTPPSKNVVLVNGVGITGNSKVVTTLVDLGPAARGLQLDAAGAMGAMRDGPSVTHYQRLFLMLHEKALLVLDRIRLPHHGRIESRFHTYAAVTTLAEGAQLRGERRALRVTLASTAPAGIFTAVDAPTTPGKAATMIRWCVRKLQTSATLATLLTPGRSAASITLAEKPGGQSLTARGADWRIALEWDDEAPLASLRLARASAPRRRAAPRR